MGTSPRRLCGNAAYSVFAEFYKKPSRLHSFGSQEGFLYSVDSGVKSGRQMEHGVYLPVS